MEGCILVKFNIYCYIGISSVDTSNQMEVKVSQTPRDESANGELIINFGPQSAFFAVTDTVEVYRVNFGAGPSTIVIVRNASGDGICGVRMFADDDFYEIVGQSIPWRVRHQVAGRQPGFLFREEISTSLHFQWSLIYKNLLLE